MKFNISLKVLPLLACGMLMASCNDFLKQEPLTDITPTDYYKDATQLQAVANAFYQTVLPYHSGAGYGTFAYDNGTDNQTGSDGDSKYKKGSLTPMISIFILSLEHLALTSIWERACLKFMATPGPSLTALVPVL